MIRADFQQGMELVYQFKMNTVTENYWLICAAATVICHYHVGYYFQSLSLSKTSTHIPCPVDRDDSVPLMIILAWVMFWTDTYVYVCAGL